MAQAGKKQTKQTERRPSARWLAVGAVVVLAALLCWLTWPFGHRAEPGAAPAGMGSTGKDRSVLEPEGQVFAQYGGSESCRKCHEEEFDLWKSSNHALAERQVDRQLDLPAFEPARTFLHGTQTTSVSWTNGAPELTT
jgi:Cytochrome c554 and c-prime